MNTSLSSVANILKSYKLLIALVPLAILLFAASILTFSRRNAPTVTRGMPWQGTIYVGTTSQEELESKLGAPIKKEQQENKTVLFYPSENRFRPNTIDVNNQTVSLVKEQITNNSKGKLEDYRQKLGPEEAVLYGPHGSFAPGHFWEHIGLLIFANGKDGIILEIWYFKPQPLETFLQTNPEITREEPGNF